VLVASLDVTAAFDTVDHQILLRRLSQAGVQGNALKWFTSYITGRHAVVKCGESRSAPFLLTSGVPQGSVLGPTLFNLYMADLARKLGSHTALKFHIYADDVLLYVDCTPDNVNWGLEQLQKGLKEVEEWMSLNHLLLSPEKTGAFVLHRKRDSPLIQQLSVTVGGRVIDLLIAGSFRWLGVEFDISLSMDQFILSTCRSCFGLLAMIRNIRSSLDKSSTLLLCNSLIVSRVDYCNSLLYAVPAKRLAGLQSVLNLAARTVTGLRRFDNISPALRELGWLSVNKRVLWKILLLIHKTLHACAPLYLAAGTVVHRPGRSLRCSNSKVVRLEAGKARLSLGSGAWQVAGPREWNVLPATLRDFDVKYSDFNKHLLKLLNEI
jgi:hypothetical protein